MQSIILIIHLLVAIIMIIAILMQRSEGGALGIGGGGAGAGGAGGLLKGRSSAGSIVKFTVILGTIFFMTSISLTVINTFSKKSVIDGLSDTQTRNTLGVNVAEDNISVDNLVKDLSPSVPISQ